LEEDLHPPVLCWPSWQVYIQATALWHAHTHDAGCCPLWLAHT